MPTARNTTEDAPSNRFSKTSARAAIRGEQPLVWRVGSAATRRDADIADIMSLEMVLPEGPLTSTVDHALLITLSDPTRDILGLRRALRDEADARSAQAVVLAFRGALANGGSPMTTSPLCGGDGSRVVAAISDPQWTTAKTGTPTLTRSFAIPIVSPCLCAAERAAKDSAPT